MQNIFSLEGKNVIITGGSGYLGSAIVEGLIAFGAKVVIADVKPSNIDSPNASYIRCNVGETESIRQCFKTARERLGAIHILINCAYIGTGGGVAQTVEEMSDEDWQKGVDGAAGTAFRCTREIVPYFEENGGGNIINFGSMYGMVSPDPAIYGDSGANNPPNYGAGKAAVLQFTRYSAGHLASKNIRVNSVAPGPFPNPHLQQEDAFVQELKQKTMLGRIGKASEMVGPVLLLASDASSFMTGANIVVDGGWMAW
ncbi:MAG: SDR family oxidoreductase [Abditibacteriaceae bacterium]